jgi:hypothetical protein
LGISSFKRIMLGADDLAALLRRPRSGARSPPSRRARHHDTAARVVA